MSITGTGAPGVADGADQAGEAVGDGPAGEVAGDGPCGDRVPCGAQCGDPDGAVDGAADTDLSHHGVSSYQDSIEKLL